EDGIRDFHVTGVQTCALPIWLRDALKTKEGLMATGELMVAATALGGLALMAKDVVAGKEPRDVFTKEGLADAFIQGGAGGLYARSEERRVGKEWRARGSQCES